MNNKILLCEQYWKNKPKLRMLKRQNGFDNIHFFDIHDANFYLVADKFMSKEKLEKFTYPHTIEGVIRITDENFKRFKPLKNKMTVYRGIRKPEEANSVLHNRFQQALNLKKGDIFYMPEYAFTAYIEAAETYAGVNSKGIVFEIELPKGTKTNTDSSYHVLPRASKFQCLANEEKEKYHLIKIRLINKEEQSFMEIKSTQNINFTSRNATIRRAEDIARRVNNAFPMQSNTKFKVMGDGWVKTLSAYEELSEKIFLMREYIDEKTSEAHSLIDKFKIFASSVKKNKVGNCGEVSRLTLLAAKLNGIRGVYEARLVSDKKALDHEIIFVNTEKPYIIDPWLGFADYEQNAICRWKNEYKKHFNFENEDWKNLRVVSYKDLGYPSEYDRELYPKEIKTLREMYPELVLKDANK